MTKLNLKANPLQIEELCLSIVNALRSLKLELILFEYQELVEEDVNAAKANQRSIIVSQPDNYHQHILKEVLQELIKL